MASENNAPGLEDIRQAYERTKKFIHQTAVVSNQYINNKTGATVKFKCENFQKVGAFKFRGACNAIFSLSNELARTGVATHSSGNHAQAVALAAKQRGIPAFIVMPEDAPKVKVNAVENYGAEITFCESTLDARENTLEQVVRNTGACFIHPYNNPKIISGQGTCTLEILNNNEHPHIILAPVGGGGLISGTAIAAKETDPVIQVVGVEPEQVNDAQLSFKTGKLHPATGNKTIADGLRTSLGNLTFECIQQYVDDIVTVSEKQIIDAMRTVWERMKIIIEPSAAVPVAALLNEKIETENKKISIIISGGNVDLDHLPWN